MQPNQEPIETPEEYLKQVEGIDLFSTYRAVLHTLARLEAEEYTSDNERQADVVEHTDLPVPASESSTPQG